ncbi:MAG: NAD(P)H-hydrate dehydratase [Dehalococcoidales bacterium]|nr:NAD(P)H-hydrate dehydratase [Dehalococcoidales bacterium]
MLTAGHHKAKLYTTAKGWVFMKLVTVSEMIAIEHESGLKGVPPAQLMEHAGLAVAVKIMDFAGHISSKRIMLLVGPGNNGGDCLVAARYLARSGEQVFLVIPARNPSNENNLRLAMEAGACLLEGIPDFKKQLLNTDVCLDGFFGTGRSRPIGGDFKTILGAVNSFKSGRGSFLTFAIDVPSGVDSDTGAIDPVAFIADRTLTLGYPKIGLYNSDAAIPVAGKITVLDIGIPAGVLIPGERNLIDQKSASRVLPRRSSNAHKGTFGRLLVVAGSDKYPGAAYLSSAGAARSGAGLVTLAVPRSLQQGIVSRLPEATYLPLDELTPGIIDRQAAEKVSSAIGGYSALLAGCGMGQTREAGEMLRLLIESARKNNLPLVLDADGLNLLAGIPDWYKNLPPGSILTPHPGEMGRLCETSVELVQKDRIGIALRKAREWNQVVVLKGAYTVIASPDGSVMVNPCSNPALASAGTGDVLAGIIAGLLVQGLNRFEAAWLGVHLHSQAGVAAARESGTIGVLASDLLPYIPEVIKSLDSAREMEQ